MRKIILVLGLMLGLTACVNNSDGGNPDPSELKTYDVNPGRADAIRYALASLFSGASEGRNALGSVRVVDDQLVVIAPRSMQKDIAKLIERVNKKGSKNSERMIVSTIYAVVATDIEDKSLVTLAPEDIKGIMESQGYAQKYFYVLDSFTSRSLDGNETEINSYYLRGKSKFVTDGDKITQSIEVASYDNAVDVKTRLVTKPDQYALLSGFKAKVVLRGDSLGTGTNRTIALITKSKIE